MVVKLVSLPVFSPFPLFVVVVVVVEIYLAYPYPVHPGDVHILTLDF